MENLQRKCRNNELRNISLVAGEFNEKIGGYIVAIPQGCLITRVFAFNDGTGETKTISVNLAKKTFNLETPENEFKIAPVNVVTTKREVVSAITTEVKLGRVMVLVEFINPDVTTGDRVTEAKVK